MSVSIATVLQQEPYQMLYELSEGKFECKTRSNNQTSIVRWYTITTHNMSLYSGTNLFDRPGKILAQNSQQSLFSHTHKEYYAKLIASEASKVYTNAHHETQINPLSNTLQQLGKHILPYSSQFLKKFSASGYMGTTRWYSKAKRLTKHMHENSTTLLCRSTSWNRNYRICTLAVRIDQSDCSIGGGYIPYTPPTRCIFFARDKDTSQTGFFVP